MNKKAIYIASIGGSVIIALSVGYYLYEKYRVNQINAKVENADDLINRLNALAADPSSAPTPPLINTISEAITPDTVDDTADYGDSDVDSSPDDGTLDNDNWDDAGGYRYVFDDGSADYFSQDGTYVESHDAEGNLVPKIQN